MNTDIARVVVLVAVGAICFLVYRHHASGPTPPDTPPPGFLPPSRQNTTFAGPDPALHPAMGIASRGRWEPAARLLAATREKRDWALRGAYVGAFATVAVRPDGGEAAFLTAWEQAVGPDDPDLAAVRAEAVVELAWQLRGSAWAKDTSQERFRNFHGVLAASHGVIAHAVELAPEDPTPLLADVSAGIGRGRSHEEMRALWARITALDPYHCGAHLRALQYWCAKWHGSEELATSFAREAAAAAPAGSLLTMLPLLAWLEHQPDIDKPPRYRTPEVTALVDAALADVAAAHPDHPCLPRARHLLAFFLTQQARYPEAAVEFRRVDGHVGAPPWVYFDDPAAAYCHWRDRAVRGGRRR
ncbi:MULTISPECIES: hypothetical protein [Streptomyces]|uniref:hypothetical protein n=1 Tax=Streptomyces TaxID=1883 RepID=UPI00068DC842|nr:MULTISPECIES: hypothetical protein [Streptomyces]